MPGGECPAQSRRRFQFAQRDYGVRPTFGNRTTSRGWRPSTLLALRPRLTTGVLVSSELVLRFDGGEGKPRAERHRLPKSRSPRTFARSVAESDTTRFSHIARSAEFCGERGAGSFSIEGAPRA